MSVFPDDLSEWNISDKYGYILEDPLVTLPGYFEPWNTLADNLPALIRRKEVRKAVSQLPALDSTMLSGHKELRLAFTQLAYISCGYVWQEGEKGVPKMLPKQLAVPLWNVSRDLGVNPGLNHASFIQANGKLIDKNGSFAAENIRAIVSFDGGNQFDWFVGVTNEIESSMVPGIKAIPVLYGALQDNDDGTILACMKTIAETISRATCVFSKLHERLDSKVLYEVIRPFAFGWGGEGNPMPDGLIYEGVSDIPITTKAGGTSLVLDAFDVLVGVEKLGYTGEFLAEERAAYITGHRQFIQTVKDHVPLKYYVTQSTNADLKEALDTITASLVGFRQYHRDVIHKYVHMASEEQNLSKGFEYDFNKNYGTGANEIIPILGCLIDDTERAYLDQ